MSRATCFFFFFFSPSFRRVEPGVGIPPLLVTGPMVPAFFLEVLNYFCAGVEPTRHTDNSRHMWCRPDQNKKERREECRWLLPGMAFEADGSLFDLPLFWSLLSSVLVWDRRHRNVSVRLGSSPPPLTERQEPAGRKVTHQQGKPQGPTLSVPAFKLSFRARFSRSAEAHAPACIPTTRR